MSRPGDPPADAIRRSRLCRARRMEAESGELTLDRKQAIAQAHRIIASAECSTEMAPAVAIQKEAQWREVMR